MISQQVTIEDLKRGLKINSLLEQTGVPIVQHNATNNILQMSEADRVDKYNDLKALHILLTTEEY